MATITISKEYGAESETLARLLADRLDYAILDKQAVAGPSERAGAPSPSEHPSPKRQSRLRTLVDQHAAETVRKVLQHGSGRLEERAYYEVTVNLVKRAAEAGNMVILGWGAQCILADRPDTLHVRVVKLLEDRLVWLQQHFAMTAREARRLIQQEEQDSASYIEHFFNRAWDDPHLYHLIVNLSKVPIEEAAAMIVSWVEQHPQQTPGPARCLDRKGDGTS